MSLNDKVALVTGASRGIGRAIALELGRRGATVIGTATTEAGAQGITEGLGDKGYLGTGMAMNVTDPSSIELMFQAIQERFAAPVILVNNAAVTRDNLLMRMKDDEWEDVIKTDLTSVYRLSKTCLRPMMKAKWGRIINISSVVGVSGNPGQTNYTAAKAGVIGFTKSLAQEIGSRGITVNAVAPGFIDTDMTKVIANEQKEHLKGMIALGRLGQPEEIAATVGFLASMEASYITGETIHVNGGMYMA